MKPVSRFVWENHKVIKAAAQDPSKREREGFVMPEIRTQRMERKIIPYQGKLYTNFNINYQNHHQKLLTSDRQLKALSLKYCALFDPQPT